MTTNPLGMSLSTSSPAFNQYAVHTAFIPPVMGLKKRAFSTPLVTPLASDHWEASESEDLGFMSKINPIDTNRIMPLTNNEYDPRRVELKPYPGHIWLAEHPAHIDKATDFGERSILVHAGGTLEEPDKVHGDLWPQLSRLGNLDLAVVDFGPVALLRSNDFHEKRVISALKYLMEMGYKADRIALSGGSKGAYAAARANAKLSAENQRLGALVLCSPVLSAHSALNILLNDLSERPNLPRLFKLLIYAIARLVSPSFLDIRQIQFDAKTPTFIIKGGQDWAHNETSETQMSEHIKKFFTTPTERKNLNWITYKDAGHKLQIQDHHARWVLSFLTNSKVGKIIGALENERFNKFPQTLQRTSPEEEKKEEREEQK